MNFAEYRALMLIRELKWRTFPQLHQTTDVDGVPLEWRRANGDVVCEYCGLKYREHTDAIEYPLSSETFDKRLCSGEIVHL